MTYRSMVVWRVALGAGLVLLLEALTRTATIPGTVLPPPSLIGLRLLDLVQTVTFHRDLLRTALEIAMSCAVGISAGLVIGSIGAQFRLFGDVVEPYLVSMYAMPTLIFYPLLLALMGLGHGPIVVITSVMVMIPVALNTMIGVREINPTLRRLGRSLGCSQARFNRSILLPAAAPLVFPGVKLGTIYAIIGAIAMEFILANQGLGYRIGFEYNNFSILNMWANILAVVVISVVSVSLLTLAERRVRRDLA